MSNEELMRRFADGDDSALSELCEQNLGLIRSRVRLIAGEYGCAGQKETLSDMESEGMLAFFQCVTSGRYDEPKGKLTTYAVPFIDGAIRSYAKKELRYAGMTVSEESGSEEQPDKKSPEASVEETVRRRLETEEMRRYFDSLSKRDRDILGKCFGVFGYQKEPLREIAMYHMVKEDAVEKAKRRAQAKLGEQILAPRESGEEE